MTRSETRQRTKLVGVRLTPEEHKVAATRAHKLGLSIQEFLRESAWLTQPGSERVSDCDTCGGPCTYEGPGDDDGSAP